MCRGRRSVTKRRLPEACQDQVYFLNQRREPTHRFETALRALRCYAIGADEDEWIELSLRLNMSIKKVKVQFRETVPCRWLSFDVTVTSHFVVL